VSGLDLRKDTPFTREGYRRSVERLVKFGGFEEVSVFCAAVTRGVEVIFTAVPPHRLTEVVFRGDTGLTPRELDSLLREHYNNSLPNIDEGLVRREVQNILNDEGYPDATVGVQRETFSDPDRATLIFDIVAGPRAQIGSVNIKISNETAITQLRVKTLTGLLPGRPYRRGPVRAGLLDVVKELKSKG
jgi:outer membrane protein assembly factor BamA